MMWLVKVTPHEPHPDYPKYYGPFSKGIYADRFAAQFDPAQAATEAIEFARKPQPGAAGKRLAPYMSGFDRRTDHSKRQLDKTPGEE